MGAILMYSPCLSIGHRTPPHTTECGQWAGAFVFSSRKDGSNNVYEYVEPERYEFWRKPYACADAGATRSDRDGAGARW